MRRDVNVSGGSVHNIKKNAEAVVVASRETGLEANAHKANYMVVSRDQDAGRSHGKNTDNSSFEGVKESLYLGTTLAYKYSIQEKIKSRLKSGNDCCHSVQNLLSSSLLSKRIKIKIYRTRILPLVL